MSSTWVVLRSDGDIDYTHVYIAENVTNAEEAKALELTLPEDTADERYRVVPLQSKKDLDADIAEYIDDEYED